MQSEEFQGTGVYHGLYLPTNWQPGQAYPVIVEYAPNGLSREEMNDLMPEIARFAGIGDFFDQPVKQYSSGMVVRVAFAVQAQVKPGTS